MELAFVCKTPGAWFIIWTSHWEEAYAYLVLSYTLYKK